MESLKRVAFVVSLVVMSASLCVVPAQAQEHRGTGGGGGHGGVRGGHMPGARPPAPPRGRPPAGPFHGPGLSTRGFRGGPAARTAPNNFRGRDVGRFTRRERQNWQRGYWHHEWHNGIYGWWWAVGPFWYFYAAPIYPYPGYVSDYVWQQPVTPVYPPDYWYFCSSSGAYYPDVPICDVPWTPVAPTPED
jgi:hypothetical protein